MREFYDHVVSIDSRHFYMIVIDECHKLRRFAIGRNRPRVVIAIEHEPDSRIVFLIGNRITVFIGRY